jgi:hypothetical protein
MRTSFLALLIILSATLFTSCDGSRGKYLAAAKIHDAYGFIDETGKFIIDPEFEAAWSFIKGSAVVKKDGLYGVIDKSGDWITEPVYDSVIPFSAECFIVIKDSVFGFAQHGTGKEIIAPRYEQVYYYTNDLCVIQKGRALGIVNSNGKIVCEPLLQDLKEMNGRMATVIQSDTTNEMDMLWNLIGEGNLKRGLINAKGEFVTACKYDEIFDDAANGYYYPFIRDEKYVNDSVVNDIPVMIGKYGIIDSTGKVVCEPVYSELPVYGDGMFRVKLNGKYGYADASGHVTIPPQWEFAVAFSEGKAIVSANGNSSIIMKDGSVLKSNLGDGTGMYRFFNNRARCRSNDGKYGFMDARGVRVVAPVYDAADDFTDGNAVVSKDNKYGVIDTNGKFVIAAEYEFIYYLGDGFYQVKNKEGKAGVMNANGETIIQLNFDNVFHLQKNYFMVESAGLSGCYDVTGKQIYPPSSQMQLFFVQGRSLVSKDSKTGMIDSTGKYIFAAEYDSIGYFFGGYTTLYKNGVYGAADSTGKIIVNPHYIELRPFLNGYAVFRKKGKFGFLNSKGEIIAEPEFEDLGAFVNPDRAKFE